MPGGVLVGSLGGCVRVVLLDFDGTVVDTMKAYADLAAPLLAAALRVGLEEARRLYLATAGRAFREQLRILGVRGAEAERVARAFEEAKKRILASLSLDGLVVERVEALKRAGLRVYLSTNNECRVISVNRGLTSLFDGVLCYDEERGLRKGREHLEEVLRRERVGLGEVVFIGDTDYDLGLYSSLGVRVVRTRGLWDPGDDAVERVLSMASCRGPRGR
ncbi:HAD family hydrolase [Stetteria hydrogenophila]